MTVGLADAPATARRALIARLQAEIHAVLGPLVPPRGHPFALLDFPDHGNVGDSAIWAGEIAYFERWHRTRPAFVHGFASGSLDWEAMFGSLAPGAPLFIHGGGNFGDLWPHHQAFREAVLARARGRRVVQLPQSIHFADPAALARTAAAIRAHGNVVLLLRDRPSLELARRHFDCDSRLCPDMAFCLGPTPRRAAPRHPVLVLARTDHERAATRDDGAWMARPGFRQADWIEEPPGFRSGQRQRSAVRSLLALGLRGVFDRAAQQELFYRRLARARLERGLSLLSSGRAVATDRLHAHILCLLLGIPHAVSDNSYGKIRRFMEAWGTDTGPVRRAPTLREAAEAARGLAG
jgi:pyruvyl transferase EpsO